MNWPHMMFLAFSRLKLNSDAFWQMTPFEFGCYCGFGTMSDTLTRSDFDILCKLYPDEEEK